VSAVAKDPFVPAGNLAGVNDGYLELVNRAITAGTLVGGQIVSDFENDLEKYLDSKHVFTLASGMDALILSLTALQLTPKSRVLVADNAGGYASLAVLSTGHVPVFCDVSAKTFLIDLDSLGDRVNGAKALIMTHLYGQMGNMEEVMSWARERSISVIEDCAQSFGATQLNKKSGTFGDIGAFSFYPTKNLGGIGDGGAICTSNQNYADRIKSLRQYGWSGRYNIVHANARNSRLDSINAAVLRAKLYSIDADNQTRREILQKYVDAFGEVRFFTYNVVAADNAAHLAVGRTPNTKEMIKFFQENGVELSRHYPIPDSKQSGLNYLGVKFSTPVSQEVCDQVVSIPIYPWLTEEQVNHVCKVIKLWCKHNV
jgi:dTDP-4-amino-4,6-dideoxygalactose transaminase